RLYGRIRARDEGSLSVLARWRLRPSFPILATPYSRADRAKSIASSFPLPWGYPDGYGRLSVLLAVRDLCPGILGRFLSTDVRIKRQLVPGAWASQTCIS